ncbi:MAG: hypothetical protein VB858_17565 [Planctomycetaceae bacterium]
MSSIHESLSRLVDVARRLRDAADVVGNLDLKSQIVDEISVLQDIHDVLAASSDTSIDLPVTPATQTSETTPSTTAKPLGKEAMSVYRPRKYIGTYALSGDDDETETTPGDQSEVPDQAPAKEATGDTGAEASDRAAQAEQTIAELEQVLQSAIRSMNSVLTTEQKRIKVRETKAAEGSGLSAAELRNRIYAAMNLTDEQKIQIADGRKQISDIRASISEELTYLMDDEQREKIQGTPEGK